MGMPITGAPSARSHDPCVPRTPEEEIIFDIWREVLELEEFSIHADFFELGGDSMDAAQVMARVARVFEVEPGVASLFENPTVANLTAVLLERRVKTMHGPATTLRSLQPGRGPLSCAQERMWFLNQLEPDQPIYHMMAAHRLKGKLDVVALEWALSEVVLRHEVLRTTYLEEDGEPVQVVRPAKPVVVPVVEVGGATHAEQEAEAMHLVRRMREMPFDLAQDCLIRSQLLRFAPEDHVLVVMIHHIAFDGWSMAIMWREMSVLYAQQVGAGPAALPDPAMQYQDYAVWQRDWLQGQELERQVAYWRRQLAGTSTLELPSDRPRPQEQTHRGATHWFDVPARLVTELHDLSRREGVTLYMTLLAAFQVLLQRYSGENDIAVGTPIAGRNWLEIEQIIGLFVNTLVMRTDLSGDPTVREVLGRVRHMALEAYRHQDLPFEKLVEELQPARHLNRNPLFDVLFQLVGREVAVPAFPGVEVETLAIPVTAARFDLEVHLRYSSGGLSGQVIYSSDLFEKATIERLINHYLVLLAAVVADPNQRISRLSLLTEAERRQLVVDWNDTSTAYPAQRCIHELVEAQVVETPDAVAAEFEGNRLTYAQLNDRANQLAHYLRSQGLGPEMRVGLYMRRSLQMLVGLLGILKTGAAYVPIDPEFPVQRVGIMLDDARPSLVITEAALASATSSPMALDVDWPKISRYSTDNLPQNTIPDNLAYVLYTSGSTGRPKGVLITHRAACNLLAAAAQVLEFSPEDRVLAMTTVSFDISLMELLLPLTAGARLTIVGRDVAQDGSRLKEVIEDAGITVMQATPSSWRLLLDAGWMGRSDLRALSGGESLPISMARDLVRRTAALWNGYGPTETTVYSTMAPIAAQTDIITIGRPIANTQVYILDSSLEPAPIGVVGDLYIGGHGISRGYLGRPDLTAERFVPNPFSVDDPLASPVIYKTGDRAAYLADGRICYLGRDDLQVKIRGVRVELGEIESVLVAHPDVVECVVVAHTTADGEDPERQLVAYVVIAAGVLADQATARRELRQYLRSRLPEAMVPAALVFLDYLPHLPNGKLDRKGLPDYSRHPEIVEGHVSPRTPEEQAIAAVWAEVLGVNTVGVHADFFELGGHSLLATKVMVRVSRLLGVEPRVKSLFENPTVARLASHLAEGRSESQTGAVLERIRDVEPIPLSFGQERLWFLDQLEPDMTAYNMMSGYRLRGRLDVRALERALGDIVSRHEVLRTVIVVRNGEPVQVVRPPEVLQLELVELGVDKGEDQEAAVGRIALAERTRRFDLAQDQMIRCKLLRLGSEDHVLLLSLHHIASDGWSMKLLWDELAALYRGYHCGEKVELPVLAVQYKDYAVWQRNWLQGPELDRQLGYWQKQLADVSTLALPTDRLRPAVQSYRGSTYQFEISAELAQKLRDLSQSQGVTLYMTLLAAFQVLLNHYTDQLDIAVGTPIAGRNREEVEGLIGFFVNTLVMRTDLSGDPTFRELLARVRRTAVEAYNHQELPFEKLVAELQTERHLATTPLFQVMFDLDERPVDSQQLPMLDVSTVAVPKVTTKFDLTLFMTSQENAISAIIEYCADLWDQESIARMAGHLVTLLAAAVLAPGQRISTLPLLTEAEQRRLLIDWNATATDYPRDHTLHQLFEAQVLRTPEATAVVNPGRDGDQSFTYHELNRRANRLAHWLRAHGIGPDVFVGVHMERSPELIVAILGIIKAGGAYLPLDSNYPWHRLAFMLDDGRVPVVLSQQRLADALAALDAAVLCLDTQWHEVESCCDENPECQINPENLAYVMYTSGSTGQPKGTEIRHRSIVRLLLGVDYVALGADQCLLQLAPVAFDASTFEIWGALLHGSRLVLAPDGVPDLVQLEELIVRYGVSILWLTASLFNLVVDNRPELLAHVRQLLTGGEAVSPKHVHLALAHLLPDARLVNGYGPTETTTFACCYQIPRDLDPAIMSIPIGRPIANTEVYVLDRRGQPVPIGVPGELHIGGDGLARGYHDRPDLTAEHFVPSSQVIPGSEARASQAAARVYRTGDLVRWRPDGNLEFIGRIDHQVKVRGYRIELGEIESVLRQHPGVQACAVVATEDPIGGRQLVAYWVSVEHAEITPLDLAEFLRRHLPDYMIPSAFVQMDFMPLTAGGKLDRQALLAASTIPAAASGGQMAPRTSLEQALVEIWAEVLPVAQIGIHDNFFALGGHSLTAIQVTSRIGQYLAIDLPLRTLFEHPTVAGLAQQLRPLSAGAETGATEERDEFVF